MSELKSLYEFKNYLRYAEYDPNQPNRLTCSHDSGIFTMPLNEDLNYDIEVVNEVFNISMLDYKERKSLNEIDYFKLWGLGKILVRFFNCIKVFEYQRKSAKFSRELASYPLERQKSRDYSAIAQLGANGDTVFVVDGFHRVVRLVLRNDAMEKTASYSNEQRDLCFIQAWNANNSLILWFEPVEGGAEGGRFQILEQTQLDLQKTVETGQRRLTILTVNSEGDKLFTGQEDGDI